MIPALLATFCFACSAVCGQRLARLMGSLRGNYWRLLLAALVLAAITLAAYPDSLRAETGGWYVLSGVIGFGIGDVALFLAYPHLGSRLTVLILMSFGVFFGAVGDWWLLRAPLGWNLGLSVMVILSGLFLALHRPSEPVRWGRGLIYAVIAGWGQGFGAVLSRLAQTVAQDGGFEVPPISQTAQRAAGGLAVAALAFAVVRIAARRRANSSEPEAATEGPAAERRVPAKYRKNLPFWLAGSALFGPVIGVSAMQWALQVLHSSALVVAITATAPLVIVPLARWVEREKTSPRALLGTAIAVAGVVMAAIFR
ncbi:MAG: EamA family transporter [Verrucomicrobiales bacterium]